MPSKAPVIADALLARLKGLGAQVRAQRKAQKVSASDTAETAGMSRVTLHRIERGEPSVTMAAYLSAADAVGLTLQWLDASAPKPPPANLPGQLRLDDSLNSSVWPGSGRVRRPSAPPRP